MQFMELKDRIREAMEGANLKRLQFAKATNRSSGAVTQWLDGTTKSLKAETAELMEAVTGYSAKWISTGRGEKMAGAKVTTLPSADRSVDNRPRVSDFGLSLAVLYDALPNDEVLRSQTYNEVSTILISRRYMSQPVAAESASPESDPTREKLSE